MRHETGATARLSARQRLAEPRPFDDLGECFFCFGRARSLLRLCDFALGRFFPGRHPFAGAFLRFFARRHGRIPLVLAGKLIAIPCYGKAHGRLLRRLLVSRFRNSLHLISTSFEFRNRKDTSQTIDASVVLVPKFAKDADIGGIANFGTTTLGRRRPKGGAYGGPIDDGTAPRTIACALCLDDEKRAGQACLGGVGRLCLCGSLVFPYSAGRHAAADDAGRPQASLPARRLVRPLVDHRGNARLRDRRAILGYGRNLASSMPCTYRFRRWMPLRLTYSQHAYLIAVQG